MANKVRGEVELVIGGKTFKLVPDFTAIAEIEDKAGVGINTIAGKIMSQDVQLKHMAALFYGGARSGGAQVTYEEMGEMIRKETIYRHIKVATDFLAECLRGEIPADEKEEAKGKNAQAPEPAKSA